MSNSIDLSIYLRPSKSSVAWSMALMFGQLIGMGSGCNTPPLKLYEGEPRPISQLATLTWPVTGHIGVPGYGIPYVCAIDGKRISDWDDAAGAVHLLPGEHVIVVAFGARHPFIAPMEKAWKRVEEQVSVNLNSGRHYQLHFNLSYTEVDTRFRRWTPPDDHDRRYIVCGELVWYRADGKPADYHVGRWAASTRLPDSSSPPWVFCGVTWAPSIEEVK